MIDLYCERTAPGLWAEPVNAVTNLAYLAAAGALRLAVGPGRTLDKGGWLLITLASAIGIGSGSFHTFATGWARLLDEVPILLFQVSFLWLYGRRIVQMSRMATAGSLAAFLAVAFVARQFPQLLNGSLMYAPALLVVAGLGVYHRWTRRIEPQLLLTAAGLLTAAVLFRTVDNGICPSFPLGTHFLWHLLTAGVLYMFGRALLINLPSVRLSGSEVRP